MTKTQQHQRGLTKLRASLSARGMKSQAMPVSHSSFDIQVGEARVELKTATTRRGPYGLPLWQFNLHHHGIVTNETDFYALVIPRFKELGFKYETTLIIPVADLKDKPSVAISPRSLLTRYAKYYDQWESIKNFRRSPCA